MHAPLGTGVEFDIIRRMLHIWGDRAQGTGDDAAVIEMPQGEQLVMSVDAAVENVHFRREWLTLEEIGYRATMAALSDLAAMAAAPRGMLLALVLPAGTETDVDAMATGVGEAAAKARCPILGGNLSRGSELSLTTTVVGSASKPLRRDGAQPGDVLYVTGELGAPKQALSDFESGIASRAHIRARFARPRARIGEAEWLAEAGATACIDISDGLGADCSHLALASKVTCSIQNDLIPCVPGVSADVAIASGEEYELLVTMPGGTNVDVAGFRRVFGIPLTRIGSVDALNMTSRQMSKGWDHFG